MFVSSDDFADSDAFPRFYFMHYILLAPPCYAARARAPHGEENTKILRAPRIACRRRVKRREPLQEDYEDGLHMTHYHSAQRRSRGGPPMSISILK